MPPAMHAIAGMGDVLTLVEKAEAAIKEGDAEAMTKRMLSAKFDFNDFLKQYKMVSGMGSMSSIMKMLPGGRSIPRSSPSPAGCSGFPEGSKRWAIARNAAVGLTRVAVATLCKAQKEVYHAWHASCWLAVHMMLVMECGYACYRPVVDIMLVLKSGCACYHGLCSRIQEQCCVCKAAR